MRKHNRIQLTLLLQKLPAQFLIEDRPPKRRLLLGSRKVWGLGIHIASHCNICALPSRRLRNNNAHLIPTPTQFSSLWISLLQAEGATGTLEV